MKDFFAYFFGAGTEVEFFPVHPRPYSARCVDGGHDPADLENQRCPAAMEA